MANKNGSNKNGKKAKKQNISIPFIGDINPKNPWGNIFFYIFLIFLFFMIFGGSGGLSPKPEQVGVNELVKLIKDERVQDVVVAGDKLEVQLKDGTKLLVEKESSISFDQILTNNEVDRSKIAGDVKVERRISFEQILTPVLMFAFPLIILFFIFRQMRSANSDITSFGKSRARLFKKGQTQITFNDVAGNEEAKTEMMEIVDFLKNPEKYRKLGARIPKGILLVGPSGVGKTLLAKAIAGEANVPFYSVAGSEFMEMLVGIGAARVRDLFLTAKKSAPSIIFIDEIDAIGRARSVGMMPSHDEREQTLNQILVEMDGFNPTEQVVVIAATNRGDLLDTALLRPGRFDRRVIVDFPDVEGRKAIAKIHAKGKPFDESVNWDRVARRTVGYSGADLENMLNEAAISAARAAREKISMEDIEDAATKVKLGPEKKRLQSDMDKKLTAYHEVGHAVVSHFLPHTDSVHRISIVSRGMALGYTLIPPAKDKLHETKTNLLERISVMMGGRAAEEVIFNEITTGASNDFDQATSVAKAMVVEYGMSSLGPINFGPTRDVTEWGKTYYEQNALSQEVMSKIDAEIKKIITVAYDRAVEIVKSKKKLMDKVAEVLIKKESIDQERLVLSDEFLLIS